MFVDRKLLYLKRASLKALQYLCTGWTLTFGRRKKNCKCKYCLGFAVNSFISENSIQPFVEN